MQNSWWNGCFGMVTYPSGARFIGEFKNHERDGKGILIEEDYWNGKTLVVKEGVWNNGKFLKPLKINLPPEDESVIIFMNAKSPTGVASEVQIPNIPATAQSVEIADSSLQPNAASENNRKKLEQDKNQQLAEERRRLEQEKLKSIVPASAPSASKASSFDGRRLALVIGNSNYSSVPVLVNSTNDAREVAKALQASGFEVSKYENIDYRQMQDAVRSFGEKLGKNDVGLFYFAGHGVQVKGKNYLIPVKENIKKAFEVPSSALDADLVLATMESAKNNLNIVILDACRSPFPGEGRSGAGGLATLDAAKGTLIAFASAPGKEAMDGKGSNSPYTKNLVKVIQQKGLTIEQVFKQVRIAVVAETNGEQVPWENSSIMGEFYFRK